MSRPASIPALFLVAVFLVSCAPLWGDPPDPAPVVTAAGGIGGTGVSPREGGIGGTGRTADVEGGIGGTGIVGTSTGVGSIIVNGRRVASDPAMPVPKPAGAPQNRRRRRRQPLLAAAEAQATK